MSRRLLSDGAVEIEDVFHFGPRHTAVNAGAARHSSQLQFHEITGFISATPDGRNQFQVSIAATLEIAEIPRVRVSPPDIGGSFRHELHSIRDMAGVGLAADRRPVKYVAIAMESFLSDIHARDIASRRAWRPTLPEISWA